MSKLVQRGTRFYLARIDKMTGEELLEWLDKNQPLPWEERNTGGPMMTVRRRALARLEEMTRRSRKTIVCTSVRRPRWCPRGGL